MSVPIYLGINLVSIYGIGTTATQNGIAASKAYRWGTIYQIGDNIHSNFVGDSVLFKATDVTCIIRVNGGAQYTLIEGAKLIITEY